MSNIWLLLGVVVGASSVMPRNDVATNQLESPKASIEGQDCPSSLTDRFFIRIFDGVFPIPTRFEVVNPLPDLDKSYLTLRSPPGDFDAEITTDKIDGMDRGSIRVGLVKDSPPQQLYNDRDVKILETYERYGLSILVFRIVPTSTQYGDFFADSPASTIIYDDRSYIQIVDENRDLPDRLLTEYRCVNRLN